MLGSNGLTNAQKAKDAAKDNGTFAKGMRVEIGE